MIDFNSKLNDDKFFEGSEVRRIDLNFNNETGTFDLTFVIHWWPEAQDETEENYPGYNRPEENHKLVTYKFINSTALNISALHYSNGDQIYSLKKNDRVWNFELAGGGKVSFSSSESIFISSEDCDAFGFTD